MVLKNVVHVGGEEVVKFLQVCHMMSYDVISLTCYIHVYLPQDTLDCLFDILSDNNEKYGELVFEALVSLPPPSCPSPLPHPSVMSISPPHLQVAIFGLMSDDRYHHFTTVLDIYIEKHFSALLAHK